MKAVSEDIAKILEANTSLVIGVDLFISKQPELPINCVTVYDTGGAPSLLTYGRDRTLRHTVMVWVRDHFFERGVGKCNTIIQVLDGLANFEMEDGTKYLFVKLFSGPNNLGTNDELYFSWSLNFEVMRE